MLTAKLKVWKGFEESKEKVVPGIDTCN